MKKYIDNIKKNKRKFYTSGLALLLLVVMIVASTYAYFKSTDASDSGFGTSVSTNTTDSLVFETGGDISITANPSNFNEGMGNQSGETYLKATLKANNKTNQASAKYSIYLDINENDFDYTDVSDYYWSEEIQDVVQDYTPELILKITTPTGEELTQLENMDYVTVKDGKEETITGFDITIIEGLIYITEGYEITSSGTEIHDWKFEVIFVNLSTDQKENGGKKFNANLIVKKDNSGVIRRVTYGLDEGIWKHKNSIKNIVFEQELIPKDNAVYSYDISLIQDESVMAYLIDNGDETFTVYIQGDGKVEANFDSYLLFYSFDILESIENLEYLDVSNVVNMESMFSGCKKLISLDVSKFDTSNVTNMKDVFAHSNKIMALDVSRWDTSKVKNMYGMFSGCEELISLDISNFDTSMVTDMEWMFYNCGGLTSLDVSKWNTSQVIYMSDMFNGCSGLTSLDVSHFDTSQVTYMSGMFFRCSGLTSLDVSNFDTSRVTNMSNMFWSCTSLTSLDVDNFDTSQVTDMEEMFEFCENLTNLDVSNWNTKNVTTMRFMFSWCKNITTLNLSNFDTSSVTDMGGMFEDCYKLTNLDFRSATFYSLEEGSYLNMFSGCPSTINVIAKDDDAKVFIEARLNEANGGTITIA